MAEPDAQLSETSRNWAPGEPAPPPAGLAVVPDWPRAAYLMQKAAVHALRAMEAGADTEMRRAWWESSIDVEFSAMVVAGEAVGPIDDEEGRPEERPPDAEPATEPS